MPTFYMSGESSKTFLKLRVWYTSGDSSKTFLKLRELYHNGEGATKGLFLASVNFASEGGIIRQLYEFMFGEEGFLLFEPYGVFSGGEGGIASINSTFIHRFLMSGESGIRLPDYVYMSSAGGIQFLRATFYHSGMGGLLPIEPNLPVVAPYALIGVKIEVEV